MTGWLKLLTNCDKILNNVIWIHLGADAGRRAGYKNFSILCLRQDVQTDAVTHEILNTFNVDKYKDKDKYKDNDNKSPAPIRLALASLPQGIEQTGRESR